MQTKIHCTGRLPCDDRVQTSASLSRLRRLGFTSCVRGSSQIKFNCFPIQPKKALRKEQLTIRSFVVPPALIRIAQRVVFRGASGRLLIETAKKGNWKIAAPVTFLLFIYSVVATWFAAWQAKRAQKLARIAAEGTAIISPETRSPPPLASVRGSIDGSEVTESGCASPSSADGSTCPICNGRGTITWDRFETNEGTLCPRCLGTGALKRRISFFS
jgi:hypothetical protein